MIGEILGKTLIVVKADTSQAKAAIKDLSDTEQKAARDRLKAQEEANETYDRGLKSFALYAAAGAAGFALLSSGVAKYREHLKELGPMGASELKKIDDASKELTRAQDTLLIAFGKLALVAAPAATAIADMATSLAGVVDGIRGVVSAAANIPGAGYVGKAAKFAWKWNPATASTRLAGDAYNYLSGPTQYGTSGAMDLTGTEEGSGQTFGQAQETVKPEIARALGWVFITSPEGGFWRPPTDAEKAAREAKKKEGARAGAKQAKIDTAAWRALGLDDTAGFGIGGRNAARGSGMLSESYGRDLTDEELLGLAGNESKGGNLGQFGGYSLDDYRRRMDSGIRGAKQFDDVNAQREGMLAEIFGPVSEFETYTTAWQGLESVVTAGLDAWIDGSKSAGEAMKAALHGFAKNLAGEALLQALRHTAYGFGMLAFPDPLSKVSAVQHFAAAAKWGAVAVAAGVIGGATRSSPGGGAGANAAAGIGGRGGAGGGRSTSLTVVMGDSFAGDSPRYVSRKIRRNIDRARMYADYEDAA